jgi:hypothetical protein
VPRADGRTGKTGETRLGARPFINRSQPDPNLSEPDPTRSNPIPTR